MKTGEKVQSHFSGSETETHTNVCWRSAPIVANNKRVCRVQRSNEQLDWFVDWRGGWFTASLDKIRSDVEEVLRLDVEGSGRPL